MLQPSPTPSCDKRKRNEQPYERSDEMVISAINEMKEFTRTESLADLEGYHEFSNPFNSKRQKILESINNGNVSQSALSVRTKINGSDKRFYDYVSKPHLFQSGEWNTSDFSMLDGYKDIASEVNQLVPSLIRIGNKGLHITTSQALVVYDIATPSTKDVNYALSVDGEFYKDDLADGTECNQSNKRTDLVKNMCKTRVGIKKGKFKKMHVLSVGTGCGKTMMATLATGICLIDKERWKTLKGAFQSFQFEDSWSGAICNSHHEHHALVRCCFVFSPKNLTSQWADTIIGTSKALIGHLKNFSSKVYVWAGRTDVYKVFMAKDLSKVHVSKLDSSNEDYPNKGNFNLKWFYENVQNKTKNASLYWILPLCSESINEIQCYPYLSYSCQIFDEYTNSTKKNNQFTRSMCFGPTIITQATLEGLSESMSKDTQHPLRIATNSSCLKRVHELYSTCSDLTRKCFSSQKSQINTDISRMIHDMQRHSFQATFITPYFLRRFLSYESQTMMMEGMDIYHVLFKNMTMSSQLGLIESDMYSVTKEEFSNNILSGISIYTYEGYKTNVNRSKESGKYKFVPYGSIGHGKAEDYEFTDVEYATAMSCARKDIVGLCTVEIFKNIETFCDDAMKWLACTKHIFLSTGKVPLVTNKMQYLFSSSDGRKQTECPVCYREEVPLKDIKMTSCCMACICDTCFHRCKICPNCRDPMGIKRNINGSMLECVDSQAEEDELIEPEVNYSTIQDGVKQLCYTEVQGKFSPKSLYDSMEGTMKILMNATKPRIIIYINYTSAMDFQGLNTMFSLLLSACGKMGQVFDMERMSANVKRSTEALHAFHSESQDPVVWVCSSTGSSQTFAGLDLYDISGMIVCNTCISTHMLDQIIGRMTRMTLDRDLHKKRVPIIHLVGS